MYNIPVELTSIEKTSDLLMIDLGCGGESFRRGAGAGGVAETDEANGLPGARMAEEMPRAETGPKPGAVILVASTPAGIGVLHRCLPSRRPWLGLPRGFSGGHPFQLRPATGSSFSIL